MMRVLPAQRWDWPKSAADLLVPPASGRPLLSNTTSMETCSSERKHRPHMPTATSRLLSISVHKPAKSAAGGSGASRRSPSIFETTSSAGGVIDIEKITDMASSSRWALLQPPFRQPHYSSRPDNRRGGPRHETPSRGKCLHLEKADR